MSDSKLELVALVADDEVPSAQGTSFDPYGALLDAADRDGRFVTFASDSYDHEAFAMPFLRAYGLADEVPIRADTRNLGTMWVFCVPAAAIPSIVGALTRFAEGVEADPSPCTAIIEDDIRQFRASLIEGAERLSGRRAPTASDEADPAMRAHFAPILRDMAAAPRPPPVTDEWMLALWRAASLAGLARYDDPDELRPLLAQKTYSNQLRCVIQAFSYLKFVRRWAGEAASQGRGMIMCHY